MKSPVPDPRKKSTDVGRSSTGKLRRSVRYVTYDTPFLLTLTVAASVARSTGTAVEGGALRAGSAILAWIGLALIDVR